MSQENVEFVRNVYAMIDRAATRKPGTCFHRIS
jgi:hypothetical protein